MTSPEGLKQLLNRALREQLAATIPGESVAQLTRLSGGANNETWRLMWGETPLILRRRPFSTDAVADLEGNILGLSLVDEAAVIGLANETDVPAPQVHAVFDSAHPIGEAFLMGFIPGESIPQRWLADEDYADARNQLAYQCGEALARIHTIDCSQLPKTIGPTTLEKRFDAAQKRLHTFGDISPVMQFGLNWLMDHAPSEAPCVLLHGDFRTGNLLIDKNGLAGVLDWELTHQGPAEEDLGYLCTNVWRFGQLDKPVGGFGHYADLIAGYESIAGWTPALEAIRYWEIFAALSWGLVCQTMGALWHSGQGDVERAAVARRRSEAELDILLLIEEWNAS
ncbi:MAG: phosphotransferase family protein [Luminiphilus sp.]|jgi:aminoglycoside phosphotransferase (APT) family kinase protein|nr:phosphotransferase family protein [Luminiphilus sp.]